MWIFTNNQKEDKMKTEIPVSGKLHDLCIDQQINAVKGLLNETAEYYKALLIDEPCAHSEANKFGCPECGEEFKRG